MLSWWPFCSGQAAVDATPSPSLRKCSLALVGSPGWSGGACPSSRAWTRWARRRRPGWLPPWPWPDASAHPRSTPRLADSGAIAAVAQARLNGGRVERLLVLVADSGLRLRHLEEVAKGGSSGCGVPVWEVLSAVLRHDGVAFALAHNHPSGDPTPTDADRAATLRVADAAAHLGLRFLDHVVVTDAGWRSVSASR